MEADDCWSLLSHLETVRIQVLDEYTKLKRLLYTFPVQTNLFTKFEFIRILCVNYINSLSPFIFHSSSEFCIKKDPCNS